MSKFKALVHVVCGETPLLGPQMSSRCVFTCGRGEGPPRGLFHKDVDPIMGAAPSRPNGLPQTPPADTVALGVRLQHTGDTTFHPHAAAPAWPCRVPLGPVCSRAPFVPPPRTKAAA